MAETSREETVGAHPVPALHGLVHGLLLALAGRLPDGDLAAARAALARRDLEDDAGAGADRGAVGVVSDVVAALRRDGQPVLDAELDVIVSALRDVPQAWEAIEALVRLAPDAQPPMAFVFAGSPDGDPAGVGVDLTGDGPPPDPVTRAVVEAVAAQPGAVGCWQAWRLAAPPDRPDAPFPRLARVFLVELDGLLADPGGPAVLAALAARLEQAAAGAGDPAALAEVCTPQTRLTAYHAAARTGGALVWARQPPGDLPVVEVHGPDGTFAADHPRLDGGERARVLEYLRRGQPVLLTTGTAPDVVDPGRGDAVPLSLRTDGTLVWSDAVTYYAAEHGLAPAPELLARALAAEPGAPVGDGVGVFRALRALVPGPRRPAEVVTSTHLPHPLAEPAAHPDLARPGGPRRWHDLLLRLSGGLPAADVVRARALLADGELAAAAEVAVRAALRHRTPVREADAELLAAALMAARVGDDLVVGLGDLVPFDEVLAEEAGLDDLTAERPPSAPAGPAPAVDGGPDPVAAALVEVCRAQAGVVAVWQCWRVPASEAGEPGRVVLVQVDGTLPGPPDGDALPAVAALVQDAAAAAAGREAVAVEVFPDVADLPLFQAWAWVQAGLLWAAEPLDAAQMPSAVPRIAQSHDVTDPDRPRLAEDVERDWVLEYLLAGARLPLPGPDAPDPLDPGRGTVVPGGARTDGVWVWPESAAHHLREHGLAPDADLLEHIRAEGYLPRPVTPALLHRTVTALALLDADPDAGGGVGARR